MHRFHVAVAAVSFLALFLSACGSDPAIVASEPAVAESESGAAETAVEESPEAIDPESPETTVLETSIPETTAPETTVAETTVPPSTETTVVETTIPVTTVANSTDTTVPETTVAETTVPETTVPETTVPETTVPETTVPPTTVPETTVPPTTVPELVAAPANVTFVDHADDVVELDFINPGAQQQDGWTEFVSNAIAMETVEVPAIDGLETWNSGWKLPDGRYLVRGRWVADPWFPTSSQQNPASLPSGQEAPVKNEGFARPIRLFVVDIDESSVQALSHMPAVRESATAVHVNSGPDIVLQVVLLPGDRVAYTAGFSGAAYDIPYVAFSTDLPPK